MNYSKIRSSKIFRAPLIVFLVSSTIYSSTNTSTVSDESQKESKCIPEIFIKISKADWNFCLDPLSPSSDSCATVFIELKGFFFEFTYNQEQKWNYVGVKREDSANQNEALKVEQKNDSEGNLHSMLIFINVTREDSLMFISTPKISNDQIDTTQIDTTIPLKVNIKRITYKCKGVEYKIVLDERKYTYPPGYMRREPVLNYPELSMFHYGGSVRMPNTMSLTKWAVEYFYWHITKPEEIKFDDPEEIRREEEWLNRYTKRKQREENRAAKKPSRPSIIKIKPLR